MQITKISPNAFSGTTPLSILIYFLLINENCISGSSRQFNAWPTETSKLDSW